MRTGNDAMTVELVHPAEARLIDFAMGRLSVFERSEIERHLESCTTCCAVLGKQSESRDTLLELARQAVATPVSNPSLHAVASIPPELVDHPRYRIIAPLGEGGMGVVYKAEHKLMERIVALKVISKRLTANEQAVERFRREVRAAAMLQHTNIVTAYEAEEVNGLLFLVMEYVEGISLDRFAAKQKNPIPVAMACHFIRQAALGLQHAHRQGMVHRDIKPQNLMLTRKGQIKILDFGLARFGEDLVTDDGLSTPNLVVGTPDYLAPEQARNSHDVDIRADIYALGCTLYYLLARRVPFPGGTAFEKMIHHTESTPDALSKLRPDVPLEVCAIVEKMMAKDKDQRYQSPVDLATALAPYAKLGNSSATELIPIQPVMEPIFLDEPPFNPAAETESMPVVATRSTRLRSRTRPIESGRRWLIPALAASFVLFGALIIYLATRESKSGTPGDPGKENAQKTETRPNGKQPVGNLGFNPKGGLGGPKRDPRLPVQPIDLSGTKKAIIVIPKNGLFFRDLEPVQRGLKEKGLQVGLVSTQRGPVQFFGPAPPNPVRADFALTDAKNIDLREIQAIIFVGANVSEFDPRTPQGKDGLADQRTALADILKQMRSNNRVVASICTGQAVLHWYGVITTEEVASLDNDPFRYDLDVNYPSARWKGKQTVIRDGKLITASGPDQGDRFTQEVIKAIQGLP